MVDEVALISMVTIVFWFCVYSSSHTTEPRWWVIPGHWVIYMDVVIRPSNERVTHLVVHAPVYIRLVVTQTQMPSALADKVQNNVLHLALW